MHHRGVHEPAVQPQGRQVRREPPPVHRQPHTQLGKGEQAVPLPCMLLLKDYTRNMTTMGQSPWDNIKIPGLEWDT